MLQRIKKATKRLIKYMAYRIFSFARIVTGIPRTKSECSLEPLQDNGRDTFFGYYDKFPENSTGAVIFHSAKNTNRHPRSSNTIDIVFREKGNEKRLCTKAFNWQQGSRLQWINNREFIFNDFDQNTGDYICRCYNTETETEMVYRQPVQDAFADEFYISLDYHALSRYAPDYGYFCKSGVQKETDSGLEIVYFKDGKNQKLLNSKEIFALLGLNKNKVFHYYFNHVMISPDGCNFIFMFRFSDNLNFRNDTLLVYNLNTGKTTVLVKKNMVSHCCWLNNEEIMSYMEYDRKKSYFKISISTGTIEEMYPGSKFRDGHPGFIGKNIVTDTYPDRFMIQKLMEISESGEKKILASLYHPPKYFGITRCDLHPKLKGNIIYLDSVANGKRCLYRMKYGQ